MSVEKIPVLPDNSEVLGYPASHSQRYWPRLRFHEAVAMQDSSALMFITGQRVPGRDVHLNVPFEDEGDDNATPREDLPWYRVRAVERTGMTCTKAELCDGKWYWVYETEGR